MTTNQEILDVLLKDEFIKNNIDKKKLGKYGITITFKNSNINYIDFYHGGNDDIEIIFDYTINNGNGSINRVTTIFEGLVTKIKTLIKDNIIQKENPKVTRIKENLAIVVLENEIDIKKAEEFFSTLDKKEKEVKIEDFFDIDIEKNECYFKKYISFDNAKLRSIKDYKKNEYYLTAIGLSSKHMGANKDAYENFKRGHKLGYKMCKFQLIKMYAEHKKFDELANLSNQ